MNQYSVCILWSNGEKTQLRDEIVGAIDKHQALGLVLKKRCSVGSEPLDAPKYFPIGWSITQISGIDVLELQKIYSLLNLIKETKKYSEIMEVIARLGKLLSQ